MRRISLLTLLLVFALPYATVTAQTGNDTGLAAFNAQDYTSARQAFLPRAGAGEAHAQFYLGILYLRGYGVEPDTAIARDWLRRAAGQNHAPAQFHLAELFRRGAGVAPDLREAADWYERAAEQGWFSAQMALATLYATGNSIRRDRVAAHKWFNIAAEMGLDPYNGARDALAAEMTGEEIAEARRQARAWIAAHRRWDERAIAAMTTVAEE